MKGIILAAGKGTNCCMFTFTFPLLEKHYFSIHSLQHWLQTDRRTKKKTTKSTKTTEKEERNPRKKNSNGKLCKSP